MPQVHMAKRTGCVLQGVKGPDGQDAKIVRSMRVSGNFPAHEGIEVIFDFYLDDHAQRAVYLRRRTGNKTNRRGHWTLSAIENREPAGLAQFKEFAESLGLKGANLANIICGFKPPF